MAAAILVAGATALSAMGAVAQPAARNGATAPALEPGKRVYAQWCASCHAADPGLAGTLALQHKYGGELPPALEERTDLTPETIAYFVRNGVAWTAPVRNSESSDPELAGLGASLSAPLAQRGAHV